MAVDFMTILLGLGGITLVVAIHELGHYLAARVFAIEVEVFSLGWGPRLLSWKGKGAEWRISLIPLGGYCRMKGEEDMKTALLEQRDHVTPSPGSFYAAKPWQRIVVSVAGPLANLLTATLVLAVLAMPAKTWVLAPPTIALLADYPSLAADTPAERFLVSPEAPAVKAGLMTGDRILQINGQEIKSFHDIQTLITRNPAKTLSLAVERGGQTLTLGLVPRLNRDTGGGQAGIYALRPTLVRSSAGSAAFGGLMPGDLIVSANGMPVDNTLDLAMVLDAEPAILRLVVQRQGKTVDLELYPEKRNGASFLDIQWEGIVEVQGPYGFIEALGLAWKEGTELLGLMVETLGRFGQGLNPTSAVSGPVRTISYIGEPTRLALEAGGLLAGLEAFGRVLALISIALFFGNLLPIPALDGGQIILHSAEWIRGRALKISTIQRYNLVGFALVMALLVLAVIGDIIFLG